MIKILLKVFHIVLDKNLMIIIRRITNGNFIIKNPLFQIRDQFLINKCELIFY